MPGGLVEVGETLADAATREVKEETALKISPPIFNRFDEIIAHDKNGRVERHYILAMFVTTSNSGQAIAGSDAGAVGWFSINDLSSIPLVGLSKKFILESRAILDR